jgi:hypothetical protein
MIKPFGTKKGIPWGIAGIKVFLIIKRQNPEKCIKSLKNRTSLFSHFHSFFEVLAGQTNFLFSQNIIFFKLLADYNNTIISHFK